MYHVVLAVDNDSKEAIDGAKTVADLPNAAEAVEVTVLNVFEEFDVNEEGGRVSSEELIEDAPAPESFERLEDYFERAGIEANFRREHGNPADTILDVADELDADAIAIQGRKRSPVGKAVFGSVTQDVLLRAERPVTVTIDQS